MKNQQVLILGAGAAGLMAARELSCAGCAVTIVEARDRVGGRMHTLWEPHAPRPIELGAEFIHGTPASTWRLVREAGLVAYDVPFEHLERRGGHLVTRPHYASNLKNALSGLSRLTGPDRSFADFLRQRHGPARNPEARRMAVDFVEGFDAADPERVSAKSLAQEQEGLGDVGGEGQFRLLDGYGALVGFLQRSWKQGRVRLLLNHVVETVHWERGKVDVFCRGHPQPLRGAHLLVTLPVGILQLPPEAPGAVRFSPDIAATRAAANQLGSGPIVKTIMQFREAFWETHPRLKKVARDAVFLHAPNAPFPTWWTMRPLRVPVLTGWAGGPKAVALSGLSKMQVRAAAVASLRQLFGMTRERVEKMIAAFHVHDWLADPFARGAYSYATVGGSHAYRALARPVESTLFFAGEATDSSGEASTVAGALASGERAAREILKVIG